MSESIGTFDRVWISTDDATYSALEVLEGSSIGVQEQFTDTNGIRGTRQHSADRVRRTQRMTQGRFQLAPSANELDLVLPWILGANESTDVFALAETVPARYLKVLRDADKKLYDGVKVNGAEFACAENQPLTLSLDLMGVDEATDGDATETAAFADGSGPYVMSDCVVSVGGTQYQFRQLSIQVQNALEVKYNNSITPTAIHATDLIVNVQLGLPFGDASALYGSSVGGVTVVATFTNGSKSLAITCAGVAAPKTPLPFAMRRARDLSWGGVARRTSAPLPPISVTNDPT